MLVETAHLLIPTNSNAGKLRQIIGINWLDILYIDDAVVGNLRLSFLSNTFLSTARIQLGATVVHDLRKR